MAAANPEPSAPPQTSEADYIAPEIDANTEARAYAEQQNEIVALNDIGGTWKLDVGDAFHKQWQDIKDALTTTIERNEGQNLPNDDSLSIDSSSYYQEDKVFVISLLGNTSSGKSFVARHLIGGSSDNDIATGPVCIEETEKKGATTGNVNCYVSKSDENNKTLLLDYEGEKGSAFPLLLYARRGWAHLTGSSEKAKQRRQAITDYFPKLAYILSDVVILLGNDDLASTDYLTRCHEFALKANDGVNQIPHRPVLVIVQNKCSLAQSAAPDDVTKKFFDIHGQEAATLNLYFSEIKCFCLPHNEQLQRLKNGTILDGRQIFDQQMTYLKQVFDVVRERNSQRLLTHAQWLYLLQRVIQIVQSGKSVSLHTLLSEIVGRNNDQSISIAVDSFLMRYNEESVHSPRWFTKCCQFAMKVLAHCLAVKSRSQRELMSERIIHEQCEKALKLLLIELDEFQPCEALYIGKGRSSQNGNNERPIFCYQHKGAHDGGHRTCQPVYGLTAWKQFWNMSSTDVWPGEFVASKSSNQTSNATLFDSYVNDLSRTVRDLIVSFEEDPETVCYMFTNLFRDCQNHEPTRIFRNICFCTETLNPISSIKHHLHTVSIEEREYPIMLTIWKTQLLFIRRLMDPLGSSKCKTCYKKLVAASAKSDHESTTTSCSQSDQASPECVICFQASRDFLFVPCGHRGFCEKCADNLLTVNQVCPICRAFISGKQRVHDI